MGSNKLDGRCIIIDKKCSYCKVGETYVASYGCLLKSFEKKQPMLIPSNTDGFNKKRAYKIFRKITILFNGNHYLKCHYCNGLFHVFKMTVDHINPKSGSGKNDLSNYIPACEKCNKKKGNKSYNNYMLELLGLNR
jgi:5-methylcytosine-specific restriction endonuclease McrA